MLGQEGIFVGVVGPDPMFVAAQYLALIRCPSPRCAQAMEVAARWRRPSSAILRQVIDAHGEGLRRLHLTDLAGAPLDLIRGNFICVCMHVKIAHVPV